MSQGIDAMRKTIREKDPVRPSTKLATLKGEELTTTAMRRSVDQAKLLHQLRGDLDWVVMKCLEKDRTRRYETANGLAMDLKRHLNNETVVARPPSKVYEFQKTVRRHKVGFAATAAVLAVLLIGVALTTWQAVRATQAKKDALAARQQAETSAQQALTAQADEAKQRQQADAARSQAENLVSFMIQDLQPALKDYGRLSLLQQVDEKTVAYFDALPAGLRDAKTELAHADAIAALAGIFIAAGDINAAREQSRKALALYRSVAEQHPEIPEAAAGTLNLEWTLYSLEPAHSSSELDVYQQDNLRRWRELFARFPTNIVVRQGIGSALWTRASFAAQRFNKPQEAIQIGVDLRDNIRKAMARAPENKRLPKDYAGALGVLALAYQAVGEPTKALQVSEEAETFYDQALKSDPGNLSLLAAAAEAAQNLSYRVSHLSQKRSRDAELLARERYRLLTSLDPSNATWRHDFAMCHMMECYYLEEIQQVESARQAFRKFDALLGDAQSRPEDEEKLIENSAQMAGLAALAGDQVDARTQLATGEGRFQARYDKLPIGSLDRIQARVRWSNMKSEVLAFLKDWVELEQLSRETLVTVADGLLQRPDDNELLLRRATTQYFLGTALLNEGKGSEAVAALQQALTGFRDTPPEIRFTENRDSYIDKIKLALTESLAKTEGKELHQP
jgi:tetratricopeptide (TPR) repeat protein